MVYMGCIHGVSIRLRINRSLKRKLEFFNRSLKNNGNINRSLKRFGSNSVGSVRRGILHGEGPYCMGSDVRDLTCLLYC